MKFIIKYGIGFYILTTLMYKVSFLIPNIFPKTIFYVLMGFGILVMPLYYKVLYSNGSLRTFWIFHLVNLLNIVYFLLFDYSNIESLLYLLTKLAGFNLIMLSMIYNYPFYKEFLLKYFKYIILLVLLLGYFYGGSETSDMRLAIGFNPNDVGLFGVLGLFSIITFEKKWYKSKIDIMMVLLFLIISLLSGSKAALLGIFLVAFLNYGFSLKNFGFAFIFGLVVLLSSTFGYNTSIDRFFGKEKAFDTREEVYRNGILTFMDEFSFGNGLDKYGWANPKYYETADLALGPHNTYIAIGIMYGVIFGSLFLILLLVFLFKTRSKILFTKDTFLLFSYYFLVIVMVNGFFETLIVGVGEFITVIFWFFIGIVAFAQSFKIQIKNVSSHKAV